MVLTENWTLNPPIDVGHGHRRCGGVLDEVIANDRENRRDGAIGSMKGEERFSLESPRFVDGKFGCGIRFESFIGNELAASS